MTSKTDQTPEQESLDRLKRYNPFVTELKDRNGIRAEHFQFFDGSKTLVTVPITEFDGYPLKREYAYFLTTLLLVAAAIALPTMPFFWPGLRWQFVVIGLPSYFAVFFILAVFVSFHLTNIRNAYANANKGLHAADFLVKARAIRETVHKFKVIVRWRRFLRYTMNAGHIALVALIVVVVLQRILAHTVDWNDLSTSALLLAATFASLYLFEAARLIFTQGMDPTLALVLMVEETGRQLLAARHPTIIGQSE